MKKPMNRLLINTYRSKVYTFQPYFSIMYVLLNKSLRGKKYEERQITVAEPQALFY